MNWLLKSHTLEFGFHVRLECLCPQLLCLHLVILQTRVPAVAVKALDGSIGRHYLPGRLLKTRTETLSPRLLFQSLAFSPCEGVLPDQSLPNGSEGAGFPPT